MRILIAIMIPNLFARPATAWITVLVIVLHGVTVWAMMSIDSPKPLETKNKLKVIELELITLAAQPKQTPSSTTALTSAPQSKPVPLESALPKKPPAESTGKSESVKLLPVMEAVEPLKTKIENKPVVTVKDTEKSETVTNLKTPLSAQELTTVVTRKIVNASNKTDSTEDDLSSMIRTVTEQYNRDQAIQKRAAKNQANRKRDEQQQWQLDAANEAVRKMLALAAAQAKQQITDQVVSDDEPDKTNQDTSFLADYGSWADEKEPTTSIPSLVWRNVSKHLGDVFIVMLELHVNKAGDITEVQLLESSGSPIIDAIATTQVRAGQLNPLIHNDIAVDGIVPMSLVYERP